MLQAATLVLTRCFSGIVGVFSWGPSSPAQHLVGRLVGGYGIGVSSGIRAEDPRLLIGWRALVIDAEEVLSGTMWRGEAEATTAFVFRRRGRQRVGVLEGGVVFVFVPGRSLKKDSSRQDLSSSI